ncbi:MAG: hypothetical protein J0I06_11795 [Planctomycetes bacterium]|nr:hypothetical protein [Planctomycetota bacterium]
MMHLNKCRMCEGKFTSQRSDAKTCSPKCRQALKRIADKEEEEIEAVWNRRRKKPCDDELPEPKIVCTDCGIRRYDGERCEVCGSVACLTLT